MCEQECLGLYSNWLRLVDRESVPNKTTELSLNIRPTHVWIQGTERPGRKGDNSPLSDVEF
jgi:hypothetical protein